MAQVKKTLKQKIVNALFFTSFTVFVGAVMTVALFIIGFILTIFDYLTSTL
jgi:hypothetical protein